MKTFVLLFVVIAFNSLAFARIEGNGKKSCPIIPLEEDAGSLALYRGKLKANRIEILEGNTVQPANVKRFIDEFKKFPEPLRQEMRRRGARILLMEGSGVGIDPTLEATTTVDGTRSWMVVPGAGGEVSEHFNIPTRIAINHLYENHGSVNLVLHEHAHTLDSLYGTHGVSKSSTWISFMSSVGKSAEFTRMICGQYCLDREEERFAELFAYYHACGATRKHMESEVPEIAEFFENLTSIKDLLRGRVELPAIRDVASLPAKKIKKPDETKTKK